MVVEQVQIRRAQNHVRLPLVLGSGVCKASLPPKMLQPKQKKKKKKKNSEAKPQTLLDYPALPGVCGSGMQQHSKKFLTLTLTLTKLRMEEQEDRKDCVASRWSICQLVCLLT
jgi:hypothetical protein